MQTDETPDSHVKVFEKRCAPGSISKIHTQSVSVLPSTQPSQPSASFPTLPHGSLHQPRLSTVAWTLLLVLRGAVISVVCSWPILLCFSAGNVFTGVSTAKQSRTSFAVAILMWSKLLNWGCVCTSYTALVLPQLLRKSLKKPSPTFFACWRQVVRETLAAFLGSSGVLLLVGIALCNLKQETRVYKLEFYFAIVVYHVDTTASSMASTGFFLAFIGAPLPRRKHLYWRRFSREFVKMIWNVGAYVLAALYTHTTYSLTLSTQTYAFLFTAGSLAIKVALQEVAKVHVFRLKLQNSGVMAALVGIPTILIDTQMRITLLRAKDTKTTLQGTFAMAVVEVLLRFGKSLWIVHQIRRRREAATGRTSRRRSVLGSSGVTAISPSPRTSSLPHVPEASSSYTEFLHWRSRLLHYHAAEIYVDMLGEYMALGCSYAILYVYWDHPKYLLKARSDQASSEGDSSTTVLPNFQPLVFAVQLGLEIAADCVACTLETWSGIDFAPLRHHSFFISVFLVWAVAGNIIMASNLLICE